MNVDAAMLAELRRIRLRVPEAHGVVLAGTDGMLIASDVSGMDPHHLAALAAASHGLNHRFAQTVGHHAPRESAVRATGGIVVTYPAGQWALFTVIAAPEPEATLLRAEAETSAHRLGRLWDSVREVDQGLDEQVAGPASLADPLDPHAPLAVRTPMATLPAGLRQTKGWRPGTD